MFNAGFLDGDDGFGGGMPPGFMRRTGFGATPRRFDEYYRCYPVAMLPGPERDNVNYGGKIIMPPSALDKLSRLHIAWPMMFELINGNEERTSHAGVLEFIAEEGKVYLPFWLMQQLALEPGDLVQVKSTDLPSGSFIKLQAQSTSFLDISDPKAVLETVLRNYSCLTKGDIFTFEYNDQTFDMAVLETRPTTDKNAVSVVETDIEVDFAAPKGYVEPQKTNTTTSTHPGSKAAGSHGLPAGGMLHPQGTMAQAINYAAIAPETASGDPAAKPVSGHFRSGGHKLRSASSKANASQTATPQGSTPQASTPVGNFSTNLNALPLPTRRGNGPQPLRLPPGKLFFGYEVKPLRNNNKNSNNSNAGPDSENKPTRFLGQGQSLRSGTRKKGEGGT